MAKQAMTRGMTKFDRIVAWTMMAGLMVAAFQYAQSLALPTHFV